MNSTFDGNTKPADNNIEGGIYLTALMLKHKAFIIIFVLVFTIASVVISLLMPNIYSSTVSVVPPKSSGSMLEAAMGNISSALKDFGMTKIGGEGEGNYSPMVIMKSRTLEDSLIKMFSLAMHYDIPENKMSEIRAELEDNMDITIEKAGNYTITISDRDPKLAADMANTCVRLTNEISTRLAKDEAVTNRAYLEDRLRITENTLRSIGDSLGKFSGEKLVLAPMEQASSISNAFSELKAKMMESEIMLDLYKSTYGENDPYTSFQKTLVEKLKAQVNQAQSKPGFAGNFTMKEAGSVGVEYLRMYAEFETYAQVKAFLQPMLEKAQLDEKKSSVNLYVLDNAVPADKKTKPKRSVIVLGTFFGSLVMAMLLIILVNSYRRFMAGYKEFQV